MSLSNKIALVTGASGGIGSAISVALAKLGAIVIGTGLNNQEVEQIEANFKANGVSGYGKAANVTDLVALEKMINDIKSEFGVISILINNAGITNDNLMMRMKDDEWNSVINIDLNSIFHVTKLCLRDMVKNRWGRIINISSVVGVIGNPGQANYSAAKAGILGFTKSLAQEVASRSITVNAIAPGFIDTPMTQKLNEEQRNAILSRIPMNRLGTPKDIANAISFLVSEEANYITGQTVHINGGLFMA